MAEASSPSRRRGRAVRRSRLPISKTFPSLSIRIELCLPYPVRVIRAIPRVNSRGRVRALLNNGLPEYIIDEAENEPEIEMRIKLKKYQLIILDIDIPQGDFVKLMHWILTITPDANILIFSMHEEHIYGQRYLQLGARGYLHKSANDGVILNAINRVLSGKKYISPDLAEILADNKASDSNLNPLLKLSLREMEIMLLLSKGKTLAEICDALKIQYSTASTFKRRILEKLNIKNMHSLYKFMQSYNLDTY